MTPEELENMRVSIEDSALAEVTKRNEILLNFPDWSDIDSKLSEIENAIPAMANLNDAKILLGKIMGLLRKDVRVTYWLAKGTQS